MRRVLCAALLAGGPGAAQDADRGAALALQLCAECHLVAPDGVATDAAPPFATIGALPQEADAFLIRWLNEPHPNMPLFDLSRAEIADLLAYMRSLAPPADEG